MEISSGRGAATRPIPARDTTPAARPALLPRDTLGVLQAEFPRYRIWREDICGRVRYIARSLEGGLRPHTVVTADLAEMRPALEPSQYALWTPFSTENRASGQRPIWVVAPEPASSDQSGEQPCPGRPIRPQ